MPKQQKNIFLFILFKNEDKVGVENYGSIGQINCIAKNFTSNVLNRIQDQTELVGLIPEYQKSRAASKGFDLLIFMFKNIFVLTLHQPPFW